MEIAKEVMFYAWFGWFVLMLPVLAVLLATSWLIAHVGNVILGNLKAIYRYECIKFYFEKMEKEGTHAFRNNEPPANN